MKKITKVFLIFVLLFVSGCNITDWGIGDIAGGISDFFTTYTPLVICWFMNMSFTLLNAVALILGQFVSAFTDLMPTVDLPTVDFSNLPFVGYAAYFFPISEAVDFMRYFLEFYLSFRLLKILFRGLRIFR